jgi:hypothetical protein
VCNRGLLATEIGEDKATPTATTDLEAIALEFAAKHPERGQESLHTLYHSQKPAVRIPKKLFRKKPGLGRKPRR